jgi:hypothetical protein
MKAIVHIGMEKTGSTSIQHWRARNSAHLNEAGVHFLNNGALASPDVAIRNASGHLAFTEYCIAEAQSLHRIPIASRESLPRQYLLAKDRLAEIASSKKDIFITCEHLFYMTEGQIRALDSLVSDQFSSVAYVLYLRDPIDWQTSFYSQALRAGFHTEFKTYMLQRGAKLPSAWAGIHNWSRIAGDKLKVRVLAANSLVGGDLLDDISSFLNVAVGQRPSNANESIAAEYCDYVCHMNHAFSRRARTDEEKRLRRKVVEYISELSRGKSKIVAPDYLADAIWATIAESIESIRLDFFRDREILFESRIRGDGNLPEPLTDTLRSRIDAEIAERFGRIEWTQE